MQQALANAQTLALEAKSFIFGTGAFTFGDAGG